MLRIIRSPVPGVEPGADGLPTAIDTFLQGLGHEPFRSLWVVPTGPRRCSLLHAWTRSARHSAVLLPGLYTLEGFVAHALGYSPRPRVPIRASERLLRVARAWYEAIGRTPGPGLVRQLDRFLQDWQACGLGVPTEPADVWERLVGYYLRGLEADGRLDPMASVRSLTAEVADPESWLHTLFLRRVRAILFDGFHRLERAELELLAALSRRCDVLVWLVGVPGQVSGGTVQAATDWLLLHGAEPQVTDHVPGRLGPLPALGRSLFPVGPARPVRRKSASRIFRLEAAGPAAEVEAVARRIKADFLAPRTRHGTPWRLSDVAVVIPGPAYEPLIREIFPRVGLPFHFADCALPLAYSRPARVLTAALELIRGHWRHDLLLDFLSRPLVQRRLERSDRLYDLFAHRPRARQELSYETWTAAWNTYLRKLRARIAAWNAGEPLPDGIDWPREEYLRRQTELADGLERLLTSLHTVLAPVAALDRLLRVSPGGAGLRELIGSFVELLRAVRIDEWLQPPRPSREPGPEQPGPAVPWAEYEKDQQAYAELLGLLDTLAMLPAGCLPPGPAGRPDLQGAFRLALAAETYQAGAEDDAGVQVFELSAIRGLRLRQVYVLGMTDGPVASLADEGATAGKRQQVRELREQHQQREAEQTYLLTQVLEAAGEMVVLARPRQDEDRPTLPGLFLAAVEERVPLAEVPAARLVASVRDAAQRLGRAAADGQAATPASLWPGCERQAAPLRGLVESLAAWQKRAELLHGPRVEAPKLLRLAFPDHRAFSPRSLETYAACPFRYFGLHVLGLAEREPDPTRLLYGSLVHRVLHRFYQQRRQQFPGPADEPLPPVAAAHRPELLRLFEEEWLLLDDGVLPPDLRQLFRHEAGVLGLFLEVADRIEQVYGNLLNEFIAQDGRGGPLLLGHDRHGRPIFLTGKVDRVDVHRGTRTRAVILDYKTGKPPATAELLRKLADGRFLQLSLYGWLLAQVRPGLEVVGGAYVHLHEGKLKAPGPLRAVGCWSSAGGSRIPFDPEAARRVALQLVEAIREGDFSLTRYPAGKHGECTAFCPLRHACRQPDGYTLRRS